MLFVSPEVGSRDLEAPLRTAGLSVDASTPLQYADIEFAGRGVKGKPVLIGVEVKRLSELTGDYDRFAGVQVPKMQAPAYDYRWLVYEGEWVTDKRSGLLTRWGGRRHGKRKAIQGQANTHALRKKLLTLEMCGGFHTHRTY